MSKHNTRFQNRLIDAARERRSKAPIVAARGRSSKLLVEAAIIGFAAAVFTLVIWLYFGPALGDLERIGRHVIVVIAIIILGRSVLGSDRTSGNSDRDGGHGGGDGGGEGGDGGGSGGGCAGGVGDGGGCQ